MGRAKAKQKLGGHRNVGSGVTGQSKSQAGGLRGAGNFVGDDCGVDVAPGIAPGVVDIPEWEFLEAAKPWSRSRVKKYLNAWANELNLLSSLAQLPAFYGLCAAAMKVDRWQRALDAGGDKTPEEVAMAEDQLIKAWRDCQMAIQKLDLKQAVKMGEAERLADAWEDI